MPYGIKYTLTQALRDGSNLYVNIYEKDYTGDLVINYDAVNIQLNSNASEDEPLAAIISSQLNISFIVSDENYDDFPDLLNFDVRKYFVKVYTVDIDYPIWVGFLFNDYVQVPFTTGYVQVDLVAIDGLSFLENTKFNFYELKSINAAENLMDIIAECLNVIAYPDPIQVLTSCSYYAEGMYNRADASSEEPFDQTYQYRRDYQGLTYYEVLDNIIKSFGCRLFQSDGKWQILAINEMANDTRYYTNYAIYPTVSNAGSGVFNKDVTINPYSNGNVHFVNNTQTKIIRKGYPKLILGHTYSFPDNYAHNGNFKGLNTSTSLYGWYLFGAYGLSAQVYIFENPDNQSNIVQLRYSLSGTPTASMEMGDGTTFNYLPYIVGPSFTISFTKTMFSPKAKMEISIQKSSIDPIYYFNSSDYWQTSQTFIDINRDATSGILTNYSKEINLFSQSNPVGSSIIGYVRVKIYVDSSTYGLIQVSNFKIEQNIGTQGSLNVIRQISSEDVPTKDLTQPYGTPSSLTDSNNLGVFFNASNQVLKNWYRYPNTTEEFLYLQMLIARQYSNLLNKNFGTLEGDLGKFETEKGLNYLDKVYLVTDPISTPLSYDGKKFLLNRGSIVPQIDEVDSMQIIEITNVDNESTETIQYINT
jgi:hypothetical protein